MPSSRVNAAERLIQCGPNNVAAANKGEVLIIAYWFPPENASGSARPARFHRYLPEYGWTSNVVAWGRLAPSDERVRYAPGGGSLTARVAVADTLARQAERVVRYPGRLSWLVHALPQAEGVLRSRPISVIVSTAPPVVTHLAALHLKRRYGLTWIADFRDPLAGNPFVDRRWVRYWNQRLERTFFSEADAVLGVSDSVVDAWRERYPHLRHKFRTVWNGFDPAETFPSPTLGNECGKRTLVHVGDIYGIRHPGIVVDSTHRLIMAGKLRPEAIELRLIGPFDADSPARSLPSFAKLVELGCLEYNERTVPRAASLQIMADAGWLLLLDLYGSGAASTVPAKIYDYIRSGRPILAVTAEGSAVERILTRSGIPQHCIRPDAPAEVVDSVIGNVFTGAMPAVADPSDWFLREFDGRRQVETLAKELDSLTSRINSEVEQR